MKKAISLFLALIMMISMSVPAFAAESSEEYYTIQVEYSDNTGHQESLDIMIQNDNVFVDAEMLAERLGYTFGENGESAVIFNKDTSNNLPFGITQFKYNSTQVSHMLFNNMIDTYEAPFASVKNNEGSWIPFEYSLLLFNSGMMITDDAVLIDIPNKRIIDYFFDVAKNSTKYGFDWADDFGYMETDIKVLGGSSHLINVFNGVLGFDGASWASLFQQFAGSMDSYDKKYGENLAILLCTESDKELQATTEKVKLLSNLLNEDGDLGKLLSFTSDMTDFQVGSLYKQCEAVLDGIKAGNSSAVDYSRAYQALEKALDKQTWFSHTGGNTLDIQKGVSSATGKVFNFLDIGVKVAEIVGYAQEFQNQDEFSLAAFTHYLESANSGLELPDAMKTSMVNYSDALSKAIDGYMVKRFLDNIDQWMSDAAKEQVPLHEVLGTQAAAALIAWDIASKTIPFIANGLSGADNFELALYSMVFQGDTFLNYLSKRDSVFANAENITAEHMYELSQYCYIYLKSCYVTREAALASLANKPDSTKEKIQPLIDYQNSINTEIAEIMVELKRANKTNDGLVFGFLPSDNENYLVKYDDEQLAQWIDQFKNRALGETELLARTESNSNHKIENYVYTDMDHDGTNELIGVYSNEMGLYQTWYCSGDGKTCVLVHQNNDGMDACEIELLNIGNETHVVLNAYRMMGTGKNYSIIALRNKEIICLISNKYGHVSMSDGGDITLDVEAYDGMYDPSIGGLILHTWKDTYLFFDGDTYKEYGALEISEQEFLEYQNSQEIKNEIESELRQSNTVSLEFTYFKRKNGIMHIQCNVYGDSGEIQYGYYTVRYEGNKLNTNLGEYTSGQMAASFSDLEVVY